MRAFYFMSKMYGGSSNLAQIAMQVLKLPNYTFKSLN